MLGIVLLKALVSAPYSNESIANIRRLLVTISTILGIILLKALVDAPYTNESSLATVNPTTTVNSLTTVNSIGVPLPIRATILLKLVIDAKEVEKYCKTNNRFSASTIDFYVPALY